MRATITRKHMFSRRLIRWLVVPVLIVTIVGISFVMEPGSRVDDETPKAASPVPPDEFEQRVEAYILNNPEIIFEAVERLQARSRDAEASDAEAALKARADEVFHDSANPVGGNPDGDVTLVEFFDYNCPYCRTVAPVVNDAVASDPQLRIVYKEFPILGPNSQFAAKAALAAHRQGRYLNFHEALMEADGAANEGSVLRIAAKVGLDVDRLRTDMEDPAIQAALSRNFELAQALRINGTPGFVVGEQIRRGATDLSTLQEIVRQVRAER